MLDGFKNFILKENLFNGEDKILLAVSGGVDSVVMTRLFREAGYSFAIAHCNFNLRGKESDGDENFVRKIAKRYGVPFFSNSFPTTIYAKERGISLQMAARELRYEWFGELLKKENFRFVATAHHLDDQAETFFINLIRGTGIAGLHGILPKQDTLIHPMLFTCRDEILTFAKRNRITYREDSSNSSDKYLRNRIRRQVIPLLKKINPEFPSALKETIHHLRNFEEIGNTLIESVRKRITTRDKARQLIHIAGLRELSPLETFSWELLSPYGFNRSVISDIISSLDSSPGKIFFSKSHCLTRDRECLIINPIVTILLSKTYTIEDFVQSKTVHRPVRLSFIKLRKTNVTEIPTSENVASLDLRKLTFPLSIRKWQSGDAFHPFGMKGRKKLSRFFIDEKFSIPEKENTWLLCSGDKIAWVIGHRIDHRFRITSKTREILRLTFRG